MQYFSLLFSGSCIPGLGDVWLLKGIKNCVMKELCTKLTRVLFLGVNRARLETVKLKEFWNWEECFCICVRYKNKDLDTISVPLQAQKSRHRLW